MKYYLGIDIGGTHIKGGIVNLLTNDIHQNILSHEHHYESQKSYY